MFSGNTKVLDKSLFPATSYNLLPYIDEVAEAAKQRTEERDRLLDLIGSHGLENVFSVHLVHKHFDLPDGHVMVYDIIRCDNIPDFQIGRSRLPERCRNLNGLFFKAQSNGRMMAYEYTTDPVANMQPHLDFVAKFSAALIEMGMQNIFALTLKREHHMGELHEFEMPDMNATVLVKNPNWLPQRGTSTPTDWAVTTPMSKHPGGVSVLYRCRKTKSGKHHREDTDCKQTRTGKHYRSSLGSGGEEEQNFSLNGENIPVCSEFFETITLARQAIEAA